MNCMGTEKICAVVPDLIGNPPASCHRSTIPAATLATAAFAVRIKQRVGFLPNQFRVKDEEWEIICSPEGGEA
jgi:hypothetical protein